MILRDAALRLLRVPSTPEPPPGSPPRTFRAAPNFLRLRLLRWALTQLLALAGLVWALYFFSWVAETRAPSAVIWMLRIVEGFAVAAFLFQVAFGWMVVQLDFEMRWYMLSDRAIRIREGVVTVREKTIALANVQNIAVHQGPLQRYLGIADVEVKTAGGGESGGAEKGQSSAEPMHVAFFRGVANATEIRDLVREGVRLQRTAGLGDPDDHPHAAPAPSDDDVQTAAAELLAEARALRVRIED